jgi:predicted dehydrogenase
VITFGALGAARITPDALLKPCRQEPQAQVSLIAARARTRAEVFALQHHIDIVVDDYANLVHDPRINAVYIALPITQHHEWAIKALRAGKHVLCEKSFACNSSQAHEMAQVAAETGLVLMDAFHYRYHPIFVRAREIYASGRLGKITKIHAEFNVSVTDPADIRMNYDTAGGVTMDIGCYPISWVRHLTALEPLEIKANAETGPKDVDVYLATEMTFPGNLAISTSGDMRAGVKFSAFIKVIGETGTMVVNNPIAPHLGNNIELHINEQVSRERFSTRPTYSYQLDAFIDAIESHCQPLTGPEDAVQQMTVIDRCYEAAGLPLRGL